MTSEEKLTKTVTPKVLEDLYNEKIAPYLNGAGNNYSLDEQVVGTWIDGKPVYQKTIDCGALPNATTKNVAHGISNIDKIIHLFGFWDNQRGDYGPIPNTSALQNDYSIQIYANATNIVIRTLLDQTSNVGYATIQYTKTTDA